MKAIKPRTHTHTHTRRCSCPWCANCWRCVPEIQSRTLLPTDAQNFTRTRKAVIKGWHISAPLPLCVGWPEIELQGFNRQIALHTAAQAPSRDSGREMDSACAHKAPRLCGNLSKLFDGRAWSGAMAGEAEEQCAATGEWHGDTEERINLRAEPVTCAGRAAGRVAAHVLPRLAARDS